MGIVELSVIIPSKNNKHHVSSIIKRISAELPDVEVEFIVIDMNSTDNSVLWALEEIKRNDLRGCVIQSGGGSICSALNTGIYKSDGKYITFVYPSRQYKNYFSDYLKTADSCGADFVFAVPPREGTAPRKLPAESIDSSKLLGELIRSRVYFDFTAVMLKREYLLRNHIKFYEDCSYGYAEAFIYNVLLYDPKTMCADTRLERFEESFVTKESGSENINCYERIDAMLKVYENIKLQRKDNLAITELFEGQKLPSVIMSVVDILLKQGFSYQAIKRSFKQKGYSEHLRITKRTAPDLRRKLIQWKYLPWTYK